MVLINMKIEVNVTKRYFFSILAVVLIVGAVIGVVAFNSPYDDPETLGHSQDELEIEYEIGNVIYSLEEIIYEIANVLNLFGVAPAPNSRIEFVEDFVNAHTKSDIGHPGVEVFSPGSGYDFYLLGTVHPNEMFDVSVVLNANSRDFHEFTSFSFGLFDPTKITGSNIDLTSSYPKMKKIAFDLKENGRTSVDAGDTWLATTRSSTTTELHTKEVTDKVLNLEDEWVEFRIKRNGETNEIDYYINGLVVASIDTNLPVVPGDPTEDNTGLRVGIVSSHDIDIDLFRISVDKLATRTDDLVCETKIYDSGPDVSEKPGYGVLDVPANCFGATGCRIVQEYYNTNGLIDTYYYRYGQEGNIWTSTHQESRAYTNGDSSSKDIIASKQSSTILLRDDHSNDNAEEEDDQWSVRDDSRARSQKIFVC